MAFLIAAAAVAAFAVAATAYDIIETRKVISKGLAVEANTFLVGKTPSTRALVLRDSIALAIGAGCLFLGWGGLAALAVIGVKHVHGGRTNAAVLAGKPAPDPNAGPGKTAWEKIIGNW